MSAKQILSLLVFCLLSLQTGLAAAQVAETNGDNASAEAVSKPTRQEMRELRREEKRAQREQREKMTAEERQQLRQDVNDAGREIYHKPKPSHSPKP